MFGKEPHNPAAIHTRELRLKQVFWGTEFTFLAVAVQRVTMNDWSNTIIIVIAAVIISFVPQLIRVNRINLAGNLLITILAVLVLYLVWHNEGTKDEVLFAMAPIITFSILFGSRRLFLFLFLLFTVNILLIGYLNDTGWMTNNLNPSSMTSSILLVIILSLSSFSVFLLARDLREALRNLGDENERYRNSQSHVHQLLHYDPLTGLPNRYQARVNYTQYRQQHSSDANACFMILDLDDFRNINESFGQTQGNLFLQKYSSRLSDAVPEDGSVARLSSDQFLLFLPSLNTDSKAQTFAEELLKSAKTPLLLAGRSIISSVSIGIVQSPFHGLDFDELCQKAEKAMKVSKATGKNTSSLYSTQLDTASIEEGQLIADLRHAIERDELELHFQPQWHYKKKAFASAEALIRWHHPTKGMVPPNVFIPLAERSGQIVDLGEWIVQQACLHCANWQTESPGVRVAINVSPIQFKRNGFADYVTQIIEEHGLTVDLIELEFTESLLLDKTGDSQDNLHKIHHAGFKLAIDDFGTGYSNLSYLKNFDIDILKIDQSFINRMDVNKQDQAIVKAVIQMAETLNMLTVAEGIEEQQTADLLEQMRCDIGQGYFWAKPMNASNFEAFLKQNKN